MSLEGKARAHGAITVVNAIASGFGAAVGIDLWTEATVKLTETPGCIEGVIIGEPEESTVLIEKTVKKVLERFGLKDKFGAHVETKSDIPIARGLKSSSTASNAIALATLAALGKRLEDLALVNLGVDASLEAGVTITGAFDDACTSYFGGLVLTDNYKRLLIKRYEIEELPVLIFVPSGKAYTSESNVERMKLVGREAKAIHKIALSGEYWTAMTLNGFLYSSILEMNTSIAVNALHHGAIAAGLSGTGPAIAAVTEETNRDAVFKAWEDLEGEIIETHITNKKAQVIGLE